jgi:hypothetical protein
MFGDLAGGLAVYSYISQVDDFTVKLHQHTGIVRRLCTLATALEVTIYFFRVQLFAAIYGNAPQAGKVDFRSFVEEFPQVG